MVFLRPAGMGVRRHAAGAELEREVGWLEKGDQGGINLRLFADRIHEEGHLHGAEVELDTSAGQIPGDVLGADQVVGGGVVHAIRLQPAPVRHLQPLMGVKAIVRPDAAERLGRSPAGAIEGRRRGRLSAQRLHDVDPGHVQQGLRGRSCHPLRGQAGRAPTKIIRQPPDEASPLSGLQLKRTRIRLPRLGQEAVAQGADLRREAGLGERLGVGEGAFAPFAQADELEEPRSAGTGQQELAALLMRVAGRPVRLHPVAQRPPGAP